MSVPRRSNRPPTLDAASSWSSDEPRVSAAWISRPKGGEIASGDSVVVRRLGERVLVAVIDALGHGPNAAKVATAASEFFHAAPDGDALGIIQGVHRALADTRGAAALAFLVSAKGVEASSVGNVELRSLQGKLPFVLTPGVLGVRLRSPRVSWAPAPLTDRFVMFSDGISGRFDLKATTQLSPAELASHIFAKHRHSHDDSTVAVVDVTL